jgi:hypothetical protein
MADQSPSLKSKVMNIKNLYLYIIGFVSSLLTLLFFYFSNQIIKEEKKVEEKVDIYKLAKEEAIKLGRMEPDEKPIVQEIGPDGKVIIPSLSYVDIGGMGENANKSFWTNIPNSNSFISFDLVLSSYQGEKLTNYLTDYDVDFRKIVYEEINKKELKQFDGSQGKKQLLEDIKNEFNAYLANKELDPVIFGAYFKVFAITTRG